MEVGDNYRVVDYQTLVTDDEGNQELEWRNTDPVGALTTDGSREGEGAPDPTTEDIENSEWVNVGFLDTEDEWHYKWIKGPFDEEFWLDDAIEQVAHKYGIVLGE